MMVRRLLIQWNELRNIRIEDQVAGRVDLAQIMRQKRQLEMPAQNVHRPRMQRIESRPQRSRNMAEEARRNPARQGKVGHHRGLMTVWTPLRIKDRSEWNAAQRRADAQR